MLGSHHRITRANRLNSFSTRMYIATVCVGGNLANNYAAAAGYAFLLASFDAVLQTLVYFYYKVSFCKQLLKFVYFSFAKWYSLHFKNYLMRLKCVTFLKLFVGKSMANFYFFVDLRQIVILNICIPHIFF